jgi:hypothetical protein
MRRAATYLSLSALLCLLSPFAMAKAESTQIYTSGVQLVAVNNHLPQATVLASPRSATQSLHRSSPLEQHSFVGEFYSSMEKDIAASVSPSAETNIPEAPASVAPKRSRWVERSPYMWLKRAASGLKVRI